MIKVITKTDKFAERIIRNGENYKRRSLFQMGAAARNELRNVVRARKKISDPNKPPSSHGVYRKTAFFKVNTKRGATAGFIDFRPKQYRTKSQSIQTLKEGFAQDTLEFGGNIRQKKSSLTGNKRSRIFTFFVRKRPHVEIAEDNLFNKNTKNTKRFVQARQNLIDKGYLK